MILDSTLAKFKECLQTVAQPTDNVFGQMSLGTQKLHHALVKITDFTKEVMENLPKEEEAKEEAPKEKAKKSDKGGKTEKKQEEKEPVKEKKSKSAEVALAEKLVQCYAFRDELRDLASVPISIVGRVNQAASIRTDTPPEVLNIWLRLLLTLFNRFLETVNPGDSRNRVEQANTDVQLEHPHAARLKAIATGEGGESNQHGGAKKNKVVAAAPNKTLTRTLTRTR